MYFEVILRLAGAQTRFLVDFTAPSFLGKSTTKCSHSHFSYRSFLENPV